MHALLQRLHARLGDFWWYSILMFAALRCGDLINAVVGLWLVPKYVPQEELGAVLPLTQFATTFGLPISILVIVFTKYLAQFKAKGELGKVKSLLRWFLGFVMVASLLTIVIAKFTLPALFERIRIQDGSLSLLIIATGIIGTVAPVFNNALQGLKKFKTITFLNLIGAPVRLVSMLVLLPIRALSGYMAGQLIPAIVGIITSTISIRKDINGSIKSVPFWKGEWRDIVKYTLLISFSALPGFLLGVVQPLIIRQRLPDVESAAYYMISRFAELGTYLGVTVTAVMFPLAVEQHAKGDNSMRLYYHMLGATLGFGALVAIMLYVIGPFLLQLNAEWKPYAGYTPEMVLLSCVLTIGVATANFGTFENAHNRFSFLWYGMPINLCLSLFLVCFTGYTYFYGILPKAIVDWMGSLHIATLRNVLITLLIGGLMKLACNLIHAGLRSGEEKRK